MKHSIKHSIRHLAIAAMALFANLSMCSPAAAQDTATDKASLEQSILREVTAGRNAATLTTQYRSRYPDGTRPRTDRSAEIRQLQQAEQALRNALQSGSPPQQQAAYAQWQAAVLIVEARQAAIHKKLADSNAGSVYQTRHQTIVARHAARHQAIRQALDALLAPTPGADKRPGASTNAASRNAATAALAHLPPAQATPDPILHASGLPAGPASLPTRAPQTTPAISPSYATASEVAAQPEDTASSPAAPLNEEILAQARLLGGDPVRIYEYVRNGSRTDWYAGSVQGATGTLRSQAGNDTDQASLLIALLRASGIASRYVRGVIELPADKIAAQLGLPDTSQLPAALTKAGIAFTPVVQGGRIAHIQLDHTWVAAQVPYTNYRGAQVDASGKSWLPLDPSYKDLQTTPANALLAEPGSSAVHQSSYLAQERTQTFAGYLKQQLTDALQAKSGSAIDYEAQLGKQDIIAQHLGLLPNTLPYKVIAVTAESAQLAATDSVTARIQITNGNSTILDTTLALADLVNQRVTLSWQPATLEDHRLVLAFGGMDAVPLYLIQLRPQLATGGIVRAQGSSSVAPGSALTLDIVTSGPFGTQHLAQTVQAGAYHTLAAAGHSPTRPAADNPADPEGQGARLLDGIGHAYQKAWNEGERQLAALTGVRLLRPIPALVIISNQMRIDRIGDTPITLSWQGVTADAIHHPVEAQGPNAKDFMALSALHGASLESTVFQDQFGVHAISADKGLALAKSQNIAILTLTGGNSSTLDASDHPPAVKEHIKNLVRLGYRIDVPASRIAYHAWTGSVWRATDDASGGAGYFISGGLAGGAVADAPDAWTLGFLADALRAANTEAGNSDPQAGVTLQKIDQSDHQSGTVGQLLPTAPAVIVRDRDGKPVAGASVTFDVTAGGGSFGNGSPSHTSKTNAAGIASAPFRPGTVTAANPRYHLKNPGDAHPTQVGINVIDASAPGAHGLLQIDAPFTAIGTPDVLAGLRRISPDTANTVAGLQATILVVAAEDQYGNPLANTALRYAIGTEPGCQAGGTQYFKPGAVYGTDDKSCPGGIPVLGDCGASQYSGKTGTGGSLAAGILLGNDAKGINTVQASSGAYSKTFVYPAAGSCSNTSDAIRLITGDYVDAEGNNIAGAAPGTPFKRPIRTRVIQESYPAEGGKQYPYVQFQKTTGNLTYKVSNGGSATATTGSGGDYSTTVTVGPAAGAHAITIDATELQFKRPDGTPYTKGTLQNQWATTVYAVLPKIDKISAAGDASGKPLDKIILDSNGGSATALALHYRIDPAVYKAGTVDIDLYENGLFSATVPGNSKTGNGKATLPRGTPFQQNRTWEAELILNRGSEAEIKSARFTLPLRQKLITYVNDSHAGATLEIDLPNQRSCERPGNLAYGFAQDVSASLTLRLQDANGAPIGETIELFSKRPHAAGEHRHAISAGQIGSGNYQYTLSATGIADPGQKEEISGSLRTLLRQSNTLPVGQVLVKGVNVKNGSLTAQTQGISLPGRASSGLALHFQPTYASGANGAIGPMGANWTHNYDSSLTINQCGEVIVAAGDGGSARFYPGPNGSLTPDAGYHGTLEQNNTDNSFDYTSKDGTRHHYVFHNARVQWKLAAIEDPNGNRITLGYDSATQPDPRLSSVQDSNQRQLSFSYATQQGTSYLQQVTGPGGLQMRFEHDQHGNLTSAERNGRKESFTYDTGSAELQAKNLLTSHTDPNGNVTGYRFNTLSLSFTPASGKALILPVNAVTTISSPAGSTGYSIDGATFKASRITDENGNATAYTFNAAGNPESITDAIGTTRMTWNAADITMASKTDARGIVTRYTYDSAGNQTSDTTSDGTNSTDSHTRSSTWLIQTARPWIKNRLLTATDRNGNQSSYQYDNRGNLTAESHPEGITLNHGYAANGDRLQTTDGNGKNTQYGYDVFGQPASSTNPIGVTTQQTRDARGRVTASRDGNGNTTTWTYDEQDRLLGKTDALGNSQSTTWDANGNKLTETDEAGRTQSWQYTALNQLRQHTDAEGNSKTLQYDPAGNKTAETDYRGNTTQYSYDAARRLVKRTEPDNKITRYVYDATGNLTSETDALGRVTTHRYDLQNRKTGTTDAQNGNRTNTWDGNGNQTSATDANGNATRYQYDGNNRLLTITDAQNGKRTRTWDKNGNKTSATDPNGNTTQYSHDDANRLVKITDPAGKQTRHDYDKNNNPIQTIDPGLNVTHTSYDALNRKKDSKDGAGHVTQYSYDPVGNLTGEIQPNGNRIVHGYDKLNRKTGSSDSLGPQTSRQYDADGNTTAETDGNGNATRHRYNALNQRTQSDHPEGRTESHDYDLMGNRTRSVDARGNSTRHQYDALNRRIQSTDAQNGNRSNTWDGNGNQTSATDPNGNTTTTVYDQLNRPVKITDAQGQSTTHTYDKNGNKTGDTDKRGTLTATAYDQLNRVTQVTKDSIVLIKNQYDANGNRILATDANGNTTGYEYDKRNLTTAENRLLGAITQYTRDAMGDITASTDPEGRKTSTAWDLRRRPVATTSALGDTTQTSYDNANNRTAITRPKGKGASHAWDSANRLVTVTDASGNSTRYQYDGNHNPVTITNANGHATKQEYDALNRRTKITHPGGATETFTYDPAGNLLTHTDGRGIVIGHSYDQNNRETGKTYSASADGLQRIDTAYDANGNPVQIVQTQNGTQTSRYNYDRFDRQESHTDASGAKAVTTFDANGNKTSLITQDGKVSKYSYDALNRLTTQTGQSGTLTYSYDKSSLRTQIASSNGTQTVFTYDAALRPQTIVHGKGSTQLARTEYEYDKNGNRTKELINRSGGAQVTAYQYDDSDRLTQTAVTDADKTVATAYEYDAVANRTKETTTTKPATGSPNTQTKTYSYNARSQLTAITDSTEGNTSLVYDANGNLTQKTQGSDTTLYTYNARDHLTAIAKNGTLLGSYASDHAGLRIEKEAKDPQHPNAAPVKTRTLWDGRNAFQDSDSSGTVLARYEHDGRHPVSMWSRDDGSQTLHRDALGSIVATTDSTGTLRSETVFDAFGKTAAQMGASANKFGYTGHQMDRESGLIYFQARYYDPQIGRFITSDPYEGDFNTPMSLHRYLYAYANPTTYIDPDGHIALLADGAEALHGFGDWLRSSAASCSEGVVCGLGSAAIGVSRAVTGLGEVGLRATNAVANIGSLALGTLGLNSLDNLDAHAKELDGTSNAVQAAYGAVSSGEGRRNIAGKALGTLDKALAGDSGAISDVAEFSAGFIGGGSVARNAGQMVRQSATQSVGSAVKGIVTREGSGLETAGSMMRGQSVAAQASREVAASRADRIFNYRVFDPADLSVTQRMGRSQQIEFSNEKFTTLYRGDATAVDRFYSKVAQERGVVASNAVISNAEKQGSVSYLFENHGLNSGESPFISFTTAPEVAETFARGVKGDQRGFVSKVQVPRTLAEPNWENPNLWEREYLIPSYLDGRFIIRQTKVGQK